ncbi:MAG: YceI family protein [Candidatus Tectomicrobia bacterium]|nr:YceI family protein [Candidatus Tectomicrobia bacterium]
MHAVEAQRYPRVARAPTRYGVVFVLGWVVAWVAVLLSDGTGQAAGRYVITPEKSQFQFRAYSLFANPLGTFRRFSGDILTDADNVGASRVRLVIEAASIDTGNTKRDKHLRNEDFLFVQRYPTIIFTSAAITQDAATYQVQGDLQIRGVTRRMTISVTVEVGPDNLVVRGEIQLNRKDFGITYNAFFNPVKDRVDVMFTIVGVRPGF